MTFQNVRGPSQLATKCIISIDMQSIFYHEISFVLFLRHDLLVKLIQFIAHSAKNTSQLLSNIYRYTMTDMGFFWTHKKKTYKRQALYNIFILKLIQRGKYESFFFSDTDPLQYRPCCGSGEQVDLQSHILMIQLCSTIDNPRRFCVCVGGWGVPIAEQCVMSQHVSSIYPPGFLCLIGQPAPSFVTHGSIMDATAGIYGEPYGRAQLGAPLSQTPPQSDRPSYILLV